MTKTRVENCVILDMREFTSAGCFDDYVLGLGFKHWPQGSMALAWESLDDGLMVTYDLPYLPAGGETHFSYAIVIGYTPTQFGGERVWFWCPGCGRQVRKLYLPWGETHFFCRKCHHLSYESQSRLTPLDKLRKIQKQLEACKPGGRRWWRLLGESKALAAHLSQRQQADFFYGVPESVRHQFTRHPDVLAALDQELRGEEDGPPARPPGRPRIAKRAYVRHKPLPKRKRKNKIESWCMRCRDYREPENLAPITFSNGRPAFSGTCPVCEAKMTVIVKPKKARS